MKKVLFVIALLIDSLINLVQAESLITPQFKVNRVYDGDTFFIDIIRCDIDVLCKNLSIRVRGIDAPEMVARCSDEMEKAKEARRYLSGKLNSAANVELAYLDRDAYFRIDATVLVDGVDIADEMVERGIARQYSGGKRGSWCN